MLRGAADGCRGRPTREHPTGHGRPRPEGRRRHGCRGATPHESARVLTRSYRVPTAMARPPTGACRRSDRRADAARPDRAAPDRRRNGSTRCREAPGRVPHPGHPPPVDRSSSLPCRSLSARVSQFGRTAPAIVEGVDVTSIEPGPAGRSGSIRATGRCRKLVIVGLVPALLALALGVLRIPDQAGAAADLGRSGRLRRSPRPVRRGIRRPADERDQATLYAASNGNGDRGALDSSRQRSDQALDTMRSGLAASTADLEPATVAALQRTQDALDPSRRCARRSRARRRHRTTRSSTATPTSSARSTCWTARSCASSAPRPRPGWPMRRRRHQRVEQLSIQHAILSGASARRSRCPATPRWSTRPPPQLVNTTATTSRAHPGAAAKFGNLPDSSATSRTDQLRSAILTAPFQLGPLADGLGHGLRPGPAEHRPHGGADQRRAVRRRPPRPPSAPATSRASTPSS